LSVKVFICLNSLIALELFRFLAFDLTVLFIFCYFQAAVRLSNELAAIKVVKLDSRMYM